VIRGTDTLAYGAHGVADVEAWRAPTATTIYEMGSITKQFTSAAIMKLVEQGRVKLDDDLSVQGQEANERMSFGTSATTSSASRSSGDSIHIHDRRG